MRYLTIKRTKSFVGCLAKMKVYIEDPTSNEMTINNVPCRKIGDLKNGEEKTFQIDERAAKIFVIADKLSQSFCNDYYQLSEGQNNIFLSGENKFNPAAGNAFRFDNNESEEVAANRKKGTRKGMLIMVIAVIVGAIIGFLLSSGYFSGHLSDKAPEAKKFSSDGMTITLTDEFLKTDIEPYTVAYDSKNVAVWALKEEFTLADGFEDNTLEQYADLVIKANNFGSVEIKNVDGLTYFVYKSTSPETNAVYQYYSYVYKADDAFWLVQFATLDENVEKYTSQITEWAKSLEFSDQNIV